MIFKTQIGTVRPRLEDWTRVQAARPVLAAVKVLNQTNSDTLTWPCKVYVGDPKHEHSNGMPLIVTEFTFAREDPK